MALLSFFILVVTLFAMMAAGKPSGSPSECRLNGFLPDQTRCSSCDDLFRAIHDVELDEECRACCNDGSGANAGSGAKFVRGELKIDRRVLQRMSSYKESLTEFPQVKVVFEDYHAPRLFMYTSNEPNAEPEVFAIHDWSSDTLIEFLKKKLAPQVEKN